MIPDTVTTVLAALQRELDALGDPGDVLQTFNAQAEFARRQSILMNAQRTIRESTSILRELEPQIAALTKWHAHLVEWRTTLLEQLQTMGPQDRQRYGHELSIKRINVGLDLQNEALPGHLVLDDLMAAEGYRPRDLVARANGECWIGSLPYVEARLRELRPRVADAQDRLDQVLAAFDVHRDMQRTG